MPAYTYKRIDDMEASFQGAFKKVRAELGVSSFGIQVLDLPPNLDAYPEHDHAHAFFVALLAGAALVALAPSGRARLPALIYAATLCGLLGTSALYHRVDWRSVRARMWMRRADHSMIFLLVAGTYTPFAVLVLHGGLARTILVVVWLGALAGVILSLAWPDAPRLLTASVYLAVVWVAVVAL